MKLDYESIAGKVKSFRVRSFGELEIEEFESNETPICCYTYQIFLDPRNTGQPCFYLKQKDLTRFEIYIWRKIPKVFKRPLILHEIVESLTMESWHYSIGEEPYEDAQRRAHNLAVDLDDRFARETLDDREYSEYKVLKEEFRRKFGVAE